MSCEPSRLEFRGILVAGGGGGWTAECSSRATPRSTFGRPGRFLDAARGRERRGPRLFFVRGEKHRARDSRVPWRHAEDRLQKRSPGSLHGKLRDFSLQKHDESAFPWARDFATIPAG